MSETPEEKIIYMVTYGPENPDKATTPFVLANAAIAMDVKAVVALQGPAVFLAKKGCLEHVFAPGLSPLKQLVESFLEGGGKLLVCGPCIKARKLEQDDLIDKAEIMAAGLLTNEILEANATLVF